MALKDYTLGRVVLDATHIFIEEAKSLNFYIYAHWSLVVTLVAEIVQTSRVVAQEARGDRVQCAFEGVSCLVYMLPLSVPMIIFIVIFQFYERGAGGSMRQGSGRLVLLWFIADVGHWVGYGLRMPYLPPTIPLTVALVCYALAHLLCQPSRTSKVTGCSGIEHMMLVIPAERPWNYAYLAGSESSIC
ncbi:hypothetical protein F5Y01DRAFT_285784 [Xylaria sp. FL0043]|nr:hypothetical protein F5Y01DRAFT_285784 [Xylaria sp. FL0043]